MYVYKPYVYSVFAVAPDGIDERFFRYDFRAMNRLIRDLYYYGYTNIVWRRD